MNMVGEMRDMKMEDRIDLVVKYAFQFIKTPYKWGGDDFAGMDCSGFVQEILAAGGWDPPGDQTAQELYQSFAKKWESKLDKGSLLFFGKSKTQITHVAFAINSYAMIEAGGGGSSVHTEEDAIRENAFVRIRYINKRSDLIAYLYPKEN